MYNVKAYPFSPLYCHLRMAVCIPSVVSNFCTLLKHRYTYQIHLNQILSRLQEIRTGHHKMTEQSHIKLSVIVLFSTQAARLWSEIKTAFGGNDTSLSSMKNLNTIKLFFSPSLSQRKHFTTIVYLFASKGSV